MHTKQIFKCAISLIIFFYHYHGCQGGFQKILKFDGIRTKCDPNWCTITTKLHFRNGSRTQRACDFNVTISKPISDKAFALMEVYRWVTNRYIKFAPMTFRVNYKNIISLSLFGVREVIKKYITPMPSWPLPINKTFMGKNMYLDERKLPPEIPLGEICLFWTLARKIAADKEYISSSEECVARRRRKVRKPTTHRSDSSTDDDGIRISTPPKLISNNHQSNEASHEFNLEDLTDLQNIPILFDYEPDLCEDHPDQDVEHESSLEADNTTLVETNPNLEENLVRNKTNINNDEDINVKEVLSSILYYVKSIDKRLKRLEIVNTRCDKQNNVLEDTKFYQTLFSLKEEEDCISTNNKINNDLTESFINFVSGIGGKNVKDNVHRILKTLFSNEFACRCSWLGQRGNFQISNLFIIKILTNLMKKTYSCTENEVEGIIKEWFRLAKLRLPKNKNLNK